ncbi:MAG TPA: MFS transporter [Mycobacteriales bacterium]|nr:MFS transporter [Mycobacteriales bacterium]
MAVSFGFARYGFGLFVPELRAAFGLSTGAVGAITSAAYVAYLFGLLGAGALSRRYGPRLPVLVGCACAAGGTGLVAMAGSPRVLVLGVVLAASSSGWCWAPFFDATSVLLPAAAHDRALAIISTGTTFGLVLAGPLALLCAGSTDGWRWAWAGFAAAATVTALACAPLLPARPHVAPARGAVCSARPLWQRSGTAPLLGLSAAFGGLGGVYFTYAVDLVRGAGLSAAWGALLWTIIGAGGLAGLAAGHLVARAGLGRSTAGCVLLLAAGTAALPAEPTAVLVVALSALGFGAAYMTLGALLAMWSTRVYPDQPTGGFTLVLVAMAAGSSLAPLAFTPLVGAAGLPGGFLCLAALTPLGALLRPARPHRR